MVIASVRFEGEGRSSGVRVPMHVHMVGTFRDGKLVRRQVFLTLPKPSKPWGCGSRRCRRRTWSCFGERLTPPIEASSRS